MNKPNSPERWDGAAEQMGIVALFAGIIAVGKSLLKHIFITNGKGKKS